MATLPEIESAVSSLPAPEQRRLLVWLQSVVEGGPQASPKRRSRRDAWLQELEERRRRGITGKAGTPLQQIMDDLRGS